MAAAQLKLLKLLLMPFIIILAALLLLQTLFTFNAATEKELSRLSTLFALRVRAWLMLVKLLLGLDVLVTDGRRSPAEQDAQHRANPKNPAYNVANPGDHILGEAVDVNFLKNGVLVLQKSSSAADWSAVVKLAALTGISWGGNFRTYYDSVHFYA